MPERIYRFDLIGEIWSGATGVVYWAWDTASLIKVCLYEWSAAPDQFAAIQPRFEKLAGSLGQDIEGFTVSPKFYFVAPDLAAADTVIKKLQSENLFAGLPIWEMATPPKQELPSGNKAATLESASQSPTAVDAFRVPPPIPPSRRTFALPLLLSLVAILLIGTAVWYFFWGQRQNKTAPVQTSAPMLRLSGSNTIGARLAADLVEAWLTSKGAKDARHVASAKEETTVTALLNGSAVNVKISARGSTTAFEDLGQNKADLGMASRRIKPAEAALLKSKGLGDLTAAANERVIGLDGVAVIVNESSDVDTLQTDQIAAIFCGSDHSRNWNIYARDDKSGTFDTFKDRVLGTRRLTSSAKRFADSQELVAAVSHDRNGIGFVGLPYAVGVKVVAVSEHGATPLVPNVTTVRTESYALGRRLYFYVPENSSFDAREFVRFVLSPQGQDVVEADGFVGLKIDVVKQRVPANAPRAYLAFVASAERLSVDFRFRPGSSDLDTKALDDVKRLVTAMTKQFAGRSIMLAGFADNTGAAKGNLVLSQQRAQTVADRMKREGIDPVQVTGFGRELPVGDNSSPEGREKNRRVEVWLSK